VIMLGEQKHMPEFERLGVAVVGVNSDRVLIVDIPVESVDLFVERYSELMEPGSWNEYVGPKTGFFGKLATGERRHFSLQEDSQREINQFIGEFVPEWSETEDLWEWLSSINIYADWLGGTAKA
jgi:hypothetical protein